MAASLVALATGCGLIDEALEDCKEDFTILYRLRLITNMQTEMDDKLDDERDRPLRLALEDHLKDIFAEFAHDVDLSFYAPDEEGRRLEHRAAIMDAGQATYEIELKAADYYHLALANLEGNRVVKLTDPEMLGTSSLLQVQSAEQTVASHNTGLFSARLPISVHREESQSFEVNLYMANCAAALIVHTDSCAFSAIRAETYDLANGFSVYDSVYSYAVNPYVTSSLIDVEPFVEQVRRAARTKGGEVDTSDVPMWTKTPSLFCSVGFPSRDESPAESSVEGRIWRINLYVTLEDGSVTKNVISLGEPLQAAHLKIIRGWLQGDGSFVPGLPPEPGPGPGPGPGPDEMVVGVSVQLDWKEGMHFDPVL